MSLLSRRVVGAVTAILLATLPPLAAQGVPQAMRGAPLFVESAPGEWVRFPSVGPRFRATHEGVLLRSRDGERSVRLAPPPGWRVVPDFLSPVPVSHHGPLGTRRLPATAQLVFEAPNGAERVALRTNPEGELELDWSDLQSSAMPAFSLELDGSDEDVEAFSLSFEAESRQRALAWKRTGDGKLRVEATPRSSLTSGATPQTQELVFGTFLGGGVGESIFDIQTTAGGDVVVLGVSNSLDFPTTPGAFDNTGDSSTDAFLAGISRDGSELLFATLFGGAERELTSHLVVEPDGSLLVGGRSESQDYPTTAGAFDETWNGTVYSPFLTRFSSDGSALLQSTFIGGSDAGAEVMGSLRQEPSGSVIISGLTCSSSWPTTSGALLSASPGGCDGFLTRLSADLSTLVASTLIGSSDPGDPGVASYLASDGSVLIAANTTLPPENIPFTLLGTGAFPEATQEDRVYLASLAPDFESVNWATWVPSAMFSHPQPDGSILMVGGTINPEFPTTPGAFSHEFGANAPWELELTACKISGDGQQLLWSTFLTTEGGGFPSDSAVDSEGRIYLTGDVATTVFPFTPDAYDTTLTGFNEGFLLVVAPDGSDVEYASLIGVGTSSTDKTFRVALDECGGAFLAGDTKVRSFGTTPGAYDEQLDGSSDAWVWRMTALSPWAQLGGALPGVQGRPKLAASGPLCEDDPTSITISDGPPLGMSFLVLGFSDLNASVKGGVLIPALDFVKPLPLDATGSRTLAFSWPAGTAPGLELWLQAWQPDPTAALNFSATNGVLATVP